MEATKLDFMIVLEGEDHATLDLPELIFCGQSTAVQMAPYGF